MPAMKVSMNQTTDQSEPAAESAAAPETAAAVGAAPRIDAERRRRAAGNFRLDFLWSLIGNIALAGSQVGLYMIFTRWANDAALGYYTLAVGIAGPVLIFTNLNLRGILVTDAEQRFSFSDYLGTRILWTLLGCVICIAAALISQPNWIALGIVLAVALSRAALSLSDMYHGLLQHHMRMRTVAQAKSLRGFGGVLLVLIITILTGRLMLSIFALAGSWLLVQFLYEMPSAAKLAPVRPRFHWRTLKQISWMGLPLGVSTAVVSLSVYMPRYFLAAHVSDAELGRFGAVSQFLMMMAVLTQALTITAAPRLGIYFAENINAFRTLLVKLSVLTLGVGLAGFVASLLAGKWILMIMYTPEYGDYNVLLSWFMLTGALLCIGNAFSVGLTAARVYSGQLTIQILRCVSLILLCQLLIPRYGLLGGAWALLGGTLVLVFASAIFLKRQIDKQHNRIH